MEFTQNTLQEQNEYEKRTNVDGGPLQRQPILPLGRRPCLDDVRISGTKTIQRVKERKAIKKTLNIRRGNRRGSFVATRRNSTYMERWFRSWFQNFWGGFLTKFPQRSGMEHVQTLVRACAAEIFGVGNCGEFSSITFADLASNEERQWIYRCAMVKMTEKKETKNGEEVTVWKNNFDHAFTMTSPEELDYSVVTFGEYTYNLMTDSEKNKNLIDKINVVDGWDRYTIQPLSDFIGKGNPYNVQLDFSNVCLTEGLELNEKLELTSEEKEYIRQKAQEWMLEYFPLTVEVDPDVNIRGVFDFPLSDDGARVIHDKRAPETLGTESEVDISPEATMRSRIEALLTLPEPVLLRNLQILQSEEECFELLDHMESKGCVQLLSRLMERGGKYIAYLVLNKKGERLLDLVEGAGGALDSLIQDAPVSEEELLNLLGSMDIERCTILLDILGCTKEDYLAYLEEQGQSPGV